MNVCEADFTTPSRGRVVWVIMDHGPTDRLHTSPFFIICTTYSILWGLQLHNLDTVHQYCLLIRTERQSGPCFRLSRFNEIQGSNKTKDENQALNLTIETGKYGYERGDIFAPSLGSAERTGLV